jgi:chemotaxis protein CheC
MQLTNDQIDALKEVVNIGVGRAASMLNEMVDSRIILEIPYIKILSAADLQQELVQKFDHDCFAAVRQSFTGSFSGVAELVFPTQSASKLVSVLTGENLGSPDLDAVKIGTLSEIGNIVINSVMGSISNVLKQHMNYALPVYLEDTVQNLLTSNNISNSTILLAQASFTIEQLEIMGDIILIFEVNSFDALLGAIERQLQF